MRVPEAVRRIRELASDTTISRSQFSGEVEKILDEVWLEAYEEGRVRLFGSDTERELCAELDRLLILVRRFVLRAGEAKET